MSEAKHTVGDMALAHINRLTQFPPARMGMTPLEKMSASLADAYVELAHLEAANAQLLAACEAVEWRVDETPYWACPSCGSYKDIGHHHDCQLAAAIKAAKGE